MHEGRCIRVAWTKRESVAPARDKRQLAPHGTHALVALVLRWVFTQCSRASYFHTHKETDRYIHTHTHTLTQGVLLKVLGPYFLCAHDIHKYEREHTHTQVCMFLSFVFAADLRGETDDIKNFRFGNGTMFWHSQSIG